MALSGMTGFARINGEADWGTWHWEARSVNGRGLDIRINMPSGLETIEKHVRKSISETFTRGSVQLALRVDMAGAQALSVNQDALQTLMRAFQTAGGDAAAGSMS